MVTLTVTHAVQRVAVRLPDGRVGELLFVPKPGDGRLAKVLVDYRHVEIDPALLYLVPVDRAEVVRSLREYSARSTTPGRLARVMTQAADLLSTPPQGEPHP